MRTMSRSWWRSLVVAAVAVVASAGGAHAQLPIPGLPQIVLDPRNLMESIETVRRLSDQISNQEQQIRHQVQALRKLNNPNWRQIGDLMMRQGALQAEAARIGAQFEEMFPGFALPANAPVQNRQRTERALRSVRQSLEAMRLLSDDGVDAQRALGRIQQQLTGVNGHQEALELQSTLIGLNAQETASLRATLGAQANAQAVYQAYVLQQQAASQATLEQTVEQFRTRQRVQGGERVDGSWRRP